LEGYEQAILPLNPLLAVYFSEDFVGAVRFIIPAGKACGDVGLRCGEELFFQVSLLWTRSLISRGIRISVQNTKTNAHFLIG
jgi:hypothetical protein